VIEINPRAPGGSLWRSALLRTGYDLELIDVALQLGKAPPPPSGDTSRYVLHYPFYAERIGTLTSWGALEEPGSEISIDRAADLGQRFEERDLQEEPYLAFAVARDDTMEGILAKCHHILELERPSITSESADASTATQ
jgi:hypothetical protein